MFMYSVGLFVVEVQVCSFFLLYCSKRCLVVRFLTLELFLQWFLWRSRALYSEFPIVKSFVCYSRA